MLCFVQKVLALGALVALLAACGRDTQTALESAPNHQNRHSAPSEHVPSWQRGLRMVPGGRLNPYELQPQELTAAVRRGRRFALDYPVTTTGLQIPYKTLARTLSHGPKHPVLALAQAAVRNRLGFDTLDGLEAWLGLAEYPDTEGEGAYYVPFPEGQKPTWRMGRSLFEPPGALGRQSLTYSCAACHADRFFGRTILGMSTRFPRANEFFVLGAETMGALPGTLLHPVMGIVRGDETIFAALKKRIGAIEGVTPLALGLDTSLALVGLSLSRRAFAGDGAFDKALERSPRDNMLRRARADSKPAVWWNTRYKNRWLSDGSVVSGNPIFTNILWNEIGRGSDLAELRDWLAANRTQVRDLTTAVFQAEAPTWFDIFGDRDLDLNAARRGAKVYTRLCASCHGAFRKAWEQAHWQGQDLMALSLKAKTQAAATTVFVPLEQTPVVDVGTDPARWQGMRGLLELNALDLSKSFGTVIEAQSGYTPPPLIGIFARYPYLHNNSVPTLCDLLRPQSERPMQYEARAAQDPATDFDYSCVGYPKNTTTPPRPEKLFRADTPGRWNVGHDEGIITAGGQNRMTAPERFDLIEYLKTL